MRDLEWKKQNELKEASKLAEISINKESSFLEIWYEGVVKYEGKEHRFWLILPKNTDDKGEPYEIDVRWWFQRVPKEIRAMVPKIIESFKELHDL